MGQAICRRFAEGGDTVVVSDCDGARAEAVAKELVGAGLDATGMQVDITDPVGCDRAVQQILADKGRLDVLCLHAGGGGGSGSVLSISDETLLKAFQLNLAGNVALLRAALRHMVERQTGAITATISEAGLRGGASGFGYGVMKHAMVGVVRHVAWTFADHGIRCNGICPGFTGHDPRDVHRLLDAAVKTGAVDSYAAEAERKVFALAPRGGTPRDLAEVHYFVCSPAASFLNGAIIPVDGGWSAG